MMKEDVPINRAELRLLLIAVSLTSSSLIAFEIALSRFLSVLLSHHYVFLVLSLALLGLGLGGMFVHLFRPLPTPAEEDRFVTLAFFASLYSLTVPFSIILILLAGHLDDVKNVLLYGIVLLIPFFLAGVLFAEIYRRFPNLSARVYGADLIGAAGGSFGAILLLNLRGGVGAHFVLGVVGSFAAMLFAIGAMRKRRRGLILSAACILASSGFLAVNLVGGYLPDIRIGANPTKEIHDALSTFEGKIIGTKWSAFGRTDLVAFDKYPGHMDIYIDGTAGSPMYRFSGDVRDPGPAIRDLKAAFPGYFPFLNLREEERDDALIIGSGGGRDILLAVMGGVGNITAVEINKDLVDMVRRYSRFNGGIYADLRGVNIVVGEGRNFLRRQKERYDIIMLSLPVTNTSRSREGYALTENFLFTTESIREYLDHLTDEGRLVVVGHNDAEVLRLLSLSLETLEKKGVATGEAMRRIYIVGSDEYLVFVLRKTPFDRAEVIHLYQAMHQSGLESMLSYFPYIGQMGAVNPALMALAKGRITIDELEKMVKEKGYDISPVTDDSPFFYKLDVGIPRPVSLVFWSSVILFLLSLLVPLYPRRGFIPKASASKERKALRKGLWRSVVLFSMLGMGFMLIEISLIQRFVLFLGYPVLSLAVLLGSLLAGAGIGSFWSGRFCPVRINRGIAVASLSVGVVVLGYTFVLPIVFDHLLGLDLSMRILAAILMLIPLGFLMGIPFPLGIRWLKDRRLENGIPWMWGINGVSSVFGSATTVVIAISLGFTEALLVSAGCYFIVFSVFASAKA
jgi:predicted membrane-bound spermidine synthase